MASYVIYPGDGTQTDFAVPFPYLSKDHVKVYASGVEVAPTWINTALIRVAPAVPLNAVLLVQRVTVKTPLTVFENTNNLTAENLTLAETQALFIAEEASDRAEQSIIVDEATGQYDFNGRRAINVADPTSDQDAVTRKWATTAMSSTLAQAIQQATNAAASATQADTDAAYAAAERLTISGWKDTIFGWMNTISGWKDTINGWYTSVQGWYNSVNAWQAQVSADKGTVAADKGTVAADKATVAADKATTSGYKDAAATSATNAATSAAAAAASAGSVDGPNLLTKSGNLGGITDPAAARSNLGLGNASLREIANAASIRANAGNEALTTDQAWAAAAVIDLGDLSGTVTIPLASGINFKFRAVGNVTITFANAKNGQAGMVSWNNTGAFTASLGGNLYPMGGEVPTFNTAPGGWSGLSYAVGFDAGGAIAVSGGRLT